MVQIELPDGQQYVSYSAFTSWLQCGKAYELGRLVEGVQETPAWYLAGGSAVHAATAQYDLARWEVSGE